MKKTRLFCLVFLFSITFFGQTALAAGPNLIQNPSFETASGNAPSLWSPVSWGSVLATFAYPVAGHAGNAAQVTLAANTTGDARWEHEPVTVLPGATYEFKAWYKSSMASEVDTKLIATNGTVSWGWVASLPSSGGVWKQVTADIVIPPTVTKLVVFHLAKTQGALTVDDYSLVKKDVTPPPNTFSEGMVTFSFDDAWASQYNNALPILQKAGLKGTFYIMTEPVAGGWAEYMNPNQVKDIAQKGHEIGGHTVTHTDLTTLGVAKIDTEVKNSKSYLQTLTGRTVNTLAYPYGAFNQTVKDRVKAAGYNNARNAGTTIANGFNTKKQNVFEINSFSPTNTVSLASMKAAIDRAKANKEWFVFSFHRVQNGNGEYFTSTADFEALVNYAKNSGIKVVTIQEGAALLE